MCAFLLLSSHTYSLYSQISSHSSLHPVLICQERGFPSTPIKPQPGYPTPDHSSKTTTQTFILSSQTLSPIKPTVLSLLTILPGFTQSVIPIVPTHKNPTGYPGLGVLSVCFGTSGNELIILAFSFDISVQEDLTCHSPTP